MRRSPVAEADCWLRFQRRRTTLAQIVLVYVASLVPCDAADDPGPSLRSLYESNRWFELRDRVASGKLPAFYDGAVAAAFHDVKRAERVLNRVIRAGPRSDDAYEAHEMLVNLYMRVGRSRDVLDHIDAMLALKPDSSDAVAVRPLFEALSRLPAQSVAHHRASAIRCSMEKGNLRIPVSVNGARASYILDTGANYSLLSESEARRVGMSFQEADTRMTDSTGGSVAFRVGIVEELAIGGVLLRHVPFLVVGDDQQPFVDLVAGERGVVGLPVLLAMRAIRWDRDGALEILPGARRKDLRQSNLHFHGAMPVVRGVFGRSEIALQLDTGATHTDLWPRFGRDFAGLLEAGGERASTRVTGVGGSVEAESIALKQVTLRIAGFDGVVRPAHVLLRELTAGSADHHGRVGMDLLNQARRVELDFQAMTLRLE